MPFDNVNEIEKLLVDANVDQERVKSSIQVE